MEYEIMEPAAYLVNLLDRAQGINKLRRIEESGRISHRSEERQTPDTWERFIRSVVLGHGDWSITEHESVTVDVICDRAIQQEWTRHRLGAYTAESTRFVNYNKEGQELRLIAPPFNTEESRHTWNRAMCVAIESYKKLIVSGCPPELARSVLPLSLASSMRVTYNLRNWRHFFLMRTTKEAHPQMKQIAIPLLLTFKERIPLLFDDIKPGARQSDNLMKGR